MGMVAAPAPHRSIGPRYRLAGISVVLHGLAIRSKHALFNADASHPMPGSLGPRDGARERTVLGQENCCGSHLRAFDGFYWSLAEHLPAGRSRKQAMA